MTQLKILMTAAAVLVSLASAPVFAQTARTLHTNKGVTYDNSGWNGYNGGGYNNTWFDGGLSLRSHAARRRHRFRCSQCHSMTIRA